MFQYLAVHPGCVLTNLNTYLNTAWHVILRARADTYFMDHRTPLVISTMSIPRTIEYRALALIYGNVWDSGE